MRTFLSGTSAPSTTLAELTANLTGLGYTLTRLSQDFDGERQWLEHLYSDDDGRLIVPEPRLGTSSASSHWA